MRRRGWTIFFTRRLVRRLLGVKTKKWRRRRYTIVYKRAQLPVCVCVFCVRCIFSFVCGSVPPETPTTPTGAKSNKQTRRASVLWIFPPTAFYHVNWTVNVGRVIVTGQFIFFFFFRDNLDDDGRPSSPNVGAFHTSTRVEETSRARKRMKVAHRVGGGLTEPRPIQSRPSVLFVLSVGTCASPSRYRSPPSSALDVIIIITQQLARWTGSASPFKRFWRHPHTHSVQADYNTIYDIIMR